MMANTYGLVNRHVDRLLARTGKVYRFVVCMVVAQDEKEARELAAKHDTFGIDWKNSEQINCETVRVYGAQAPEGFVSYQVVEEQKA
jgi:hypothetical protein